MAVTAARTGPALILVLATLTGIAPLATDMYVPGLPDLARSLGTRPSAAQLSLTTFLVGVVAGQLVLGPVSDTTGRRPVLLAGTALFAVSSLVCALAPSIVVLDVARLCQGFTGAAGIVVARAVITDLFRDAEAARKFSTLAAITSAAPILAPTVGGAILSVTSWRIVFAALAVLGLAQVAGVLVWVPESRPSGNRGSSPLAGLARLARRPAVAGYVISLCFGGAAVFAYIAGSTFVFSDVYGAAPGLVSVIYGVNALGSLAGSVLCGRLVARVGTGRLLVAGITTALAAGAVLTAALLTSGGSLALTWACLFAVITAFGVFFPAVTAAAQAAGRDAPGATSALLGGGQFLLGGAVSPLVGVFGTGSALPLALIVTGCLAVATAVVTAMRKCLRPDRT
ncbi:multidrug effflux MFS transporter [Amycolatopsis endophytica]|uniref:DHA1 family bicyclomycin/chloramphenicol resistance-like MFS transporter n=1 Tax=Amycolatopsis endophytica TaxID=860233 RepID=A0A853BBY0_9PSEU|nr:multidrug effflux MFS transporter [Amycolatopsis endophytica]NYI92878.1 DHA1 family bicyclomycin/chloramphenicol resistance-like MFS transporter [Amycolatopsis endophytica]